MKITEGEKLEKKLAPVTGPSFYYICKGCSKKHLSRGSYKETNKRELRANTRDETSTYTFADINGEPFNAYYCAQSLGLFSIDWQDALEEGRK